MKTYEEALQAATEIFYGGRFNDTKSTFFYSAMYMLAEVYEKPLENVATDLRRVVDAEGAARDKEYKARIKKKYQEANEERRLANLAKKAASGQ